jgi:hypothetical protein
MLARRPRPSRRHRATDQGAATAPA